MPSENVRSRGGRFSGGAQQAHLNLFQCPATLAVVAAWAGRNQVIPGVLPTQPSWNNVIDRQVGDALPAVLAGVVIASQDFPLGETHTRAWPAHHLLQAYN